MRLSILIASIPSRFDKARALYEHVLNLIGDKDIEVLLFMDNKKRTIGEKREALKNISKGEYFMFVDDDDSLYSIDEVYEACKDVDVVTFKNKSLNNDGSSFIVSFGLNNPIEHNSQDGKYIDLKRPPFTQCAWNKKFREIEFPSINWGEDWGWVEKCLKIAKTETFIDKIIHGYNFNNQVTEASYETKRCVVNLVTDSEGYKRGQKRLKEAMREHGKMDFLYFIGEDSVGAPKHSDNPYAFKIYAIEHARKMGYNQILWLDASVYPVKDITPVFDWISRNGVFLEEAGHWVGSWCPESVLKYFFISKEEAMKMPMFAAGYCGFDFRCADTIYFFELWKQAMIDGMFKGSWEEHRHDMTCGSILAHELGLTEKYSPGGQFFAYIGEVFGEPKETVVCHLRGLV